MERIFLIAIALIICIGAFSGCTDEEDEKEFYLNSLRGLFGDEREICAEVMQYIVDAINEKDKDAMKVLFSKRAIEESNTLDEDIEKLFNMLEGEYESHLFTHWQSHSIPEPGGQGDVKCIFFKYELQTSDARYLFTIGLCSSDRTRKRNEGIYGLYVAETDDEENNANYQPWTAGINFKYRSDNYYFEDNFEW